MEVALIAWVRKNKIAQRRAIATFLAAALCFALFPLHAFAGTSETGTLPFNGPTRARSGLHELTGDRLDPRFVFDQSEYTIHQGGKLLIPFDAPVMPSATTTSLATISSLATVSSISSIAEPLLVETNIIINDDDSHILEIKVSIEAEDGEYLIMLFAEIDDVIITETLVLNVIPTLPPVLNFQTAFDIKHDDDDLFSLDLIAESFDPVGLDLTATITSMPASGTARIVDGILS